VKELNCPNCGKKIGSPDQKFCRYCGAELKMKPKSSQPKITETKKGISKKDIRRSFALALVSSILGILSMIIGLSFLFKIINSVHKEPVFLDWVLFNEGFLYYRGEIILEEELKTLSLMLGIVFILISVGGIILGIIAKIMRQKRLINESNNRLIKISSYLEMLGIFININGLIIGVLLCFIPFYYRLFYELMKNIPSLEEIRYYFYY
jgi:hypothetical protein